MLLHNSHLPEYRQPLGPVPAGGETTIRLFCDEAEAVILRVWNGEEQDFPMHCTEGHLWEHALTVPEEPGLCWYDFIVYRADGHTLRYGAPDDGLGGEGRQWQEGLHSWQLTVYDPHYTTPEWLHGATIYQIFPDRFCKAPTAAVDARTDRMVHRDWNEDFFADSQHRTHINGSEEIWGGTINGIREKLPYLRDMGVTLLYLNPVFQAHSNHRYDTGDYTRVDPALGTNEELEALFREAMDMGIRVMLDGVFSHTGVDSIYFNKYGHYAGKGAAQGKDSPYFKWYSFERYPDKYRCWWGVPTLPEVRKDEPSYQRFMFRGEESIVQRWLLAGASGWRLDVADELTMDFLRKLRRAARHARRDAAVLGEVWEDASSKVSYGEMRCYCAGDTLDSVMNYPLRAAILDFVTRKTDADQLARLIRHQQEVYPAQFRYSLMNLIGSHDRARALNVLAGKEGRELSQPERHVLRLTHDEYEAAVPGLRCCLDILCALPGCPTVYYGDEAGMTGSVDPYCRRTYPWGSEDEALQRYYRAKLKHFRESEVLRFGHCKVEATDADTLRITRWLDGHRNALGQRTHTKGEEVFNIRRP